MRFLKMLTFHMEILPYGTQTMIEIASHPPSSSFSDALVRYLKLQATGHLHEVQNRKRRCVPIFCMLLPQLCLFLVPVKVDTVLFRLSPIGKMMV